MVDNVDNRMIVNQPIKPKQRKENTVENNKTVEKNKVSFQEILEKRLNKQKEIDFSKHAEKRIMSRGINLSKEDLQQLSKGLEKAEDKGSKDSLIMVDQVAYLVSVENRTVITAVDDNNIKENVFTNIDSAVFM